MTTSKFEVRAYLHDMDGDLSPERPTQFMKSVIAFGDQEFVVDSAADLNIRESELVRCMSEHAGTFGWWIGLVSNVRRLLRAARREQDSVRSRLDAEARNSLREDEIKVTEAAVSAWLQSDPRTRKFIDEIAALEDLGEYADGILRALEHKRDMLKEINRAQCSEQFNERH